jgi:glycosyltransferase involved in cell wall biosynthesis
LDKKIVIIGPAYPYRGGNSLFVSHVFDALSKQFDVKIYNYTLLYPSILFPGSTQFDKSSDALIKAPSDREVNSINPLNWISVADKLKAEDADLIVFDWWHPFFGPCHFSISQLIKSKYKNKILFITENVISHEGNFVDRVLTKIGLKNSSRFLCLSEQVESELKQLTLGRKVYRTELPVYDCYQSNEANLDSTKQMFDFKDDDKVLLFFGYVRTYKGLDLLIEAMPKLLEHDKKFKLLIVGEFYDSPQKYLDQLKTLNLSEHVKIINQFVANEDVYKYYLASDVVVLPYRSATQSGILNVAYGFNKPVLVTDVGGLAEFVDNEKTGVVVSDAEPEKIKEGIIKFFDLTESINFSENIIQRTSSNAFNKLPELFQQILKDIEDDT